MAKSSQENVFFSHGDWDLGCDNTLSCRAAGYTENVMSNENVAMVMLSRRAGLATKVENWVLLNNRGHCAGYTDFAPCRMPLLLTKQ